MDGLLDRKPFRNCRLISTTEIGTQAGPDNSSYSGTFGMLQRKEGDLLLDHYTQYFKKDWFEHSPPGTEEQYVVATLWPFGFAV